MHNSQIFLAYAAVLCFLIAIALQLTNNHDAAMFMILVAIFDVCWLNYTKH